MRRRSFVLGTPAAIGASALKVVKAAPAPKTSFQLGCVTYNLLKDADLEQAITMLEAAGFAGVELRTTHKHGVEPSISAARRAEVKERFARSKVKLVSYGTTCEFHAPDAAERKRQVDIGKQFVDLASDTGARGIKVRPNGLPDGVTQEETVGRIAASLRELGEYARTKNISVWMEVHGRKTNDPKVAAAIMQATNHPSVGACWNSNPEDVVNGSVKANFQLLKPWIRHCHINELASDYPWRELFTLLREANYGGFTLAEVAENPQTERFLRWYKAMWTELNRPCSS
jgi:sugar phosphate isomerase/epimerase